MEDLTQYTVKDKYNGKIIRVSTGDELVRWTRDSYLSLMPEQDRVIEQLEDAIKAGDQELIISLGAACDLEITPKKKTRRKKT